MTDDKTALGGVEQPDGHWRCFHCGEVFTDVKCAGEHFGGDMLALAACQIKAEEGGLVALIRKQEAELDSYRSEDAEHYRAFYSLGAEHTTKLRQAEESGYEKGLADGRALLPAQRGEGGVDLPPFHKEDLRQIVANACVTHSDAQNVPGDDAFDRLVNGIVDELYDPAYLVVLPVKADKAASEMPVVADFDAMMALVYQYGQSQDAGDLVRRNKAIAAFRAAIRALAPVASDDATVERLRAALESIATKAEKMSRSRDTAQPGLWDGCAEEARSALAAPATDDAMVRVPRDVCRLVIAARNVAFDSQPSPEALKELDDASEAFADRVPWDGEPNEDKQP